MIQLTDAERAKEIKRLRSLLSSNKKFTAAEVASIRGKIGGLAGKGIPGRRLGGINGAKSRWKGHKPKVKPTKKPSKKSRKAKKSCPSES